jgi:catalase
MRELDMQLGERYYKESEQLEQKYTDEIIDVIHRAIKRQLTNDGPPARRDAHAFDTGCVEAMFCIDPHLGPELSQGVFVPGKKYPAWIRFSNGNFVRTSPRWPDARGMSIKLMGVDGQKLLNDEVHTQDFILISHPTFFVDDLQSYVKTLEKFLEGSFWKQWVSAPLKLPSLRSAWIASRVKLLWI